MSDVADPSKESATPDYNPLTISRLHVPHGLPSYPWGPVLHMRGRAWGRGLLKVFILLPDGDRLLTNLTEHDVSLAVALM